MKTQQIVSTLRRDASYVWYSLIALVFVGFISVALTATLLDLIAIHR